MLISYIGLVSNKWFGENERVLSTTIMSTGMSLGHLSASLFTLVLLDGKDFETGFKTLMIIKTSSLILVSIFAVAFIDNEPEKPPSLLS
jgi:sugar phosphate permease